jgi:hypothetical protein
MATTATIVYYILLENKDFVNHPKDSFDLVSLQQQFRFNNLSKRMATMAILM